MASEYPAVGAARRSARRHAATPPGPWPAPGTAVRAVADSLLTALWTATRDLDARPGRRRLARAALMLAVLPRVAEEVRAPGPRGSARPEGTTPAEVRDRGPRDASPAGPAAGTDVPTPVAWVVGGTLAALSLAASHRAEAAAVQGLRERGVRHAGTTLGAALGVLQLAVTAGLGIAAGRRGASTARRPTERSSGTPTPAAG